jgi:hypothetical protein
MCVCSRFEGLVIPIAVLRLVFEMWSCGCRWWQNDRGPPMGREIKMSLIAPSELSLTLDPRPHTMHASPNAERYLRLGR